MERDDKKKKTSKDKGPAEARAESSSPSYRGPVTRQRSRPGSATPSYRIETVDSGSSSEYIDSDDSENGGVDNDSDSDSDSDSKDHDGSKQEVVNKPSGRKRGPAEGQSKSSKRKRKDSISDNESNDDFVVGDDVESDSEGGSDSDNEYPYEEVGVIDDEYANRITEDMADGEDNGKGSDESGDKCQDLPDIQHDENKDIIMGSSGTRPAKTLINFDVIERSRLRRPPQRVLPTWNSVSMQENNNNDQIAFMLLDGKQENETYRWPVCEELIPIVPESRFEDDRVTAASNIFDEKGMEFVDQLTGVSKKEHDYSGTDDDNGQDENEDEDSADEAYHERLMKQRRMSRKAKRLRHANERMANRRLEQVHGFLEGEFVTFARKQYQEGAKTRLKDLHSFQEQTLPPFRNRAARASVGTSDAGYEQEDALTPIQEKAVVFAAEDALKGILDRLPYVIRQGALGRAPEYVNRGLPKPVSTVADYERHWDTMMAAASLSGIDDRILKKVGLRMKNLLSLNKQSRYYEPPSEGKFATDGDANSGTEGDEVDNEVLAKFGPPFVFIGRAPPESAWEGVPRPFYHSREFVDPQDPKYSTTSILRNVRKRKAWLTKGLQHGPWAKETPIETANEMPSQSNDGSQAE
ncbi:hypothetical protein B0O80DRAFT_434231 [Mortierella sp. GBAus27b]|nr:hypothetical protein BGX31_011199 [Mortierella sp. GBA43]KAI8363662.1 hypothetical protein B0O80DRAFT_434231 [Mortierella sp. GBAus27b]